MVEEIAKAREKKFKGMTIEQLKVLDTRDCAKFLPSRSRRTILRNFDVAERFIRSCEEKLKSKQRIKTHLRDIVILPKLVGMNIGVHDGKNYQDTLITIEMIGHRLGEFALTRKRVKHSAAGIGATKGSRGVKK